MSADFRLSRRAFAGGLALLGLRRPALAQGFAGLGGSAAGFAPVIPGKTFSFPSDHGPHPNFRIEWWYVTANLVDAGGSAYGAQWTLFRQAMQPGGEREGWASLQLWMGHAAVTSAVTHRFSETFARGGVGQAGVETTPFAAWIDAWEMRGSDQTGDTTIAPLDLRASAADFSYALHLAADRPLILQKAGGLQGVFSYVAFAPARGIGLCAAINAFDVAPLGSRWPRPPTISLPSLRRDSDRPRQGHAATAAVIFPARRPGEVPKGCVRAA